VAVTGGAAGIGRGAVERFVAAGDRVFALDRDADALAALEAKLGNQVTGLHVDVANRTALAGAAAQIRESLGGRGDLDVLVCAAGIQRYGTVRRNSNAAARQQRCEDRNFEPMGIIRGRDAQATVRGREAEPGLKPCGRRQHIAMTERNELWLRGRARRLQDEGGRARIRLSVDRRGVGDLHGDI